MCSLTNIFSGRQNTTGTLLPILPACLPAGASKKVSIKLFDKQHLIGDVTNSVSGVRQTLETFFNRLHETAGVPPNVAQNLQNFSFEVLFIPRDSTPAERRAFGMMDFPVYLADLDGSQPLTEARAMELLRTHGIPQETRTRTTLDDGGVQTSPVHSLNEVKSFITDGDNKDLGVGIPGTYFMPDIQRRCRKLAIIKMNLVKKNAVIDVREAKFISGLKHEIGHMFGMGHEPGTVMDGDNREAIKHPRYTVNQLRVLNDVLTIITAP
jgi:hypothetical protein